MSDTPKTNKERKRHKRSKTCPNDPVSADFARQLERELNAALAANAELLERLRERTESHLAASARDVQTIQQQAVEIDRLKNIINHGQH